MKTLLDLPQVPNDTSLMGGRGVGVIGSESQEELDDLPGSLICMTGA